MWFDEDINLTIETGPVINVSGVDQFSNIDSVTVHEFEQPIIIQTSEYFAPVQSVNGKIGFVHIDKTDIGLSNVENISIIGVSGYLQNEINNISDDFYLNSNPSGYITGVDLSAYVTKSNGVFSNRPTVNGTGVLLSGEAAGLPTTIVYTTGNQTISGTKNFVTRPQVNNIGVVISGEAYPSNNPSGFITGVDLSSYVTGSVVRPNETGAFYPRSNPSGFITGIDLTSYATNNNLATTGSTLDTKINSLSGNLTSTYATIANLALTGSSLQTQINNLDLNYATDASVSGVATNLATTGSTLNTRINSLSGYINSPSSNIVYTTGNQTVSGSKTFVASRYVFSGADVIFTNNRGIVSGEWRFSNRPTVNGTGVLLSGEAYSSNNPSNFISSDPPTGSVPLDLLIKYVTGISTGITSYEGVFPNIYFTENPVLFISLSYENTETTLINDIVGRNRYVLDLAYRNQTGFGVVFSDQIKETGINLNVLAYGKGVNL